MQQNRDMEVSSWDVRKKKWFVDSRILSVKLVAGFSLSSGIDEFKRVRVIAKRTRRFDAKEGKNNEVSLNKREPYN